MAPTCGPFMRNSPRLVTTTVLLPVHCGPWSWSSFALMLPQGMQSLYEHIIRTSPVGDISDQTLQVRLPGRHVGLCKGPVRFSESPVRLCEAQRRQAVHFWLWWWAAAGHEVPVSPVTRCLHCQAQNRLAGQEC